MIPKKQLEEDCISFSKHLMAGGVKWEDTTSYSKYSEKIPTSFSTKIGSSIITITCGHIRYKNEWIFYCFSLGFDTYLLTENIMSPEDVGKEAIAICRNKVNELYKAFNNLN